MSGHVPGRVVGRVAGLWRYPVKSMRAEELREAAVTRHGLAGDRRWAFMREDRTHSGMPWLTMLRRPEMSQYRPRFVEPDRPDASPVLVCSPSGRELDVVDPELAAELGGGVRAVKQNPGMFDAMPLSLITTRTVADLGALVGTHLDVQRFRPNLLVETHGDDAFPEDAWVGCVLRVGAVRIRVDERDERCATVNIDPVTIDRNPAVLRAIARDRDMCLGVYASTVDPGRVAVGDPVSVEV